MTRSTRIGYHSNPGSGAGAKMESLEAAADEAVLPPLFARWMDVLLPGPIPAERNATCDRCAMLPPTGTKAGATELYFSPSTKCCTFLPELANFLVGRVLGDTDPESARGRATVEARLDNGLGVSPLGLLRTPVFSLLYQKSPGSFGHSRSLLCPHYLEEGGRCGVWRHRESTCATWFCKYGRGEKGRTFWERLHDVLVAAEDSVRTHCLAELGIAPDALESLFPPHALLTLSARQEGLSPGDVDSEPNREHHAAIWGQWRGREREFFLSCAKIADDLGWPDVLRLGGARLGLLSRLLLQAYATLQSRDIPERVRHHQLKIVYTSAESVELVGYSNIDPLRVPKGLVDALHHFDGRPTADALADIDRTQDLRVAPGVVRKLVDFGILVEEK